MEPLVAATVLASAVLHPLWYALVKRDPDPDGAFMAVNGGIAVLALIHGLVLGVDFLAALALWPLMLLSCLGQLAYGYAVVLVLKRADLSAYYPIIRSSPLALVAIGFFFFGERYAATLLIGIFLVLAGAFALQFKPGARLLSDPVALLFSLVALFGSALYAIADSRMVQTIHPTAMLVWVQAASVPLLGLMFAHGRSDWRSRIFPVAAWNLAKLRYALICALAYVSYYLILLAYSLGGNVAAVNAVRQIAIPVSVFIGGMWLSEGSMGRRLGASLILAAGVVIIVVFR
jgi:drug/metabolite transporter (DMT)-like permease